jgi:FixJ family two-component response regulator
VTRIAVAISKLLRRYVITDREISLMQSAHVHSQSREAVMGGATQTPVVFIIDQDASARDSLDVVIRAAGWRAECFASAEEFLARPRALKPGCLLLDVSLPQLDGLALQEIVADRREMPVIFITSQHDVRTTVRAMKAGAVDFMIKPCAGEAIVSAVRCALDRSVKAIAEEAAHRALTHRFELLTERERQVFRLVVTGLLNKQVAAQLGISEITVKAHRGKMMRKMAADSIAALVRMATQMGFAVGNRRLAS